MSLRRRLERANGKTNPDRNRPAVDCIIIVGSFSEPKYKDSQVKPSVDSVLVWSPCGWHFLAPTDRKVRGVASSALGGAKPSTQINPEVSLERRK